MTTFAQQTNFNVLTPKTHETLMKLEAFTDLDAPIEYNNIGTVPITIGISNSEENWSPNGNEIQIPALSSVTISLSDLTNNPAGYLSVYNNNGLLAAIGVFESNLEPVCFSVTPPDDIIGDIEPIELPGYWYSDLNVVYTCPEVNVGVGTLNPQAKIEIFDGINNTLPAFKYNSETPVIITKNGKLGVGTNNPEAPIHISSNSTQADDKLMIVGDYANTTNPKGFVVYQDGRIFSREVQVTINAFPDYVFEKDYSLMPLDQLEGYIKKNGHLPNVPSAKDVEENNGEVNLGEMNRILLEKVEELTLYIIELEKKIEGR